MILSTECLITSLSKKILHIPSIIHLPILLSKHRHQVWLSQFWLVHLPRWQHVWSLCNSERGLSFAPANTWSDCTHWLWTVLKVLHVIGFPCVLGEPFTDWTASLQTIFYLVGAIVLAIQHLTQTKHRPLLIVFTELDNRQGRPGPPYTQNLIQAGQVQIWLGSLWKCSVTPSLAQRLDFFRARVREGFMAYQPQSIGSWLWQTHPSIFHLSLSCIELFIISIVEREGQYMAIALPRWWCSHRAEPDRPFVFLKIKSVQRFDLA